MVSEILLLAMQVVDETTFQPNSLILIHLLDQRTNFSNHFFHDVWPYTARYGQSLIIHDCRSWHDDDRVFTELHLQQIAFTLEGKTRIMYVPR